MRHRRCRAPRGARARSSSVWMTCARTTSGPGDPDVVEIGDVSSARSSRGRAPPRRRSRRRACGRGGRPRAPAPPPSRRSAVRAGEGEAGAVRDAQPSPRRAVPALREALGLGERLAPSPVRRSGGVRGRVVHQRVPARDAHPRGVRRAEDGVRVADRCPCRGAPSCRPRGARRGRGARRSPSSPRRARPPPARRASSSHGRSGRSSGPFRRSVWQRWMCVWTKPGRSQRPRASTPLERPPRRARSRRPLPRVAVERDDRAVLDEDRAVRRHVPVPRHPDHEGVLDEEGSSRGLSPRPHPVRRASAPSWTSSQRFRGTPPP